MMNILVLNYLHYKKVEKNNSEIYISAILCILTFPPPPVKQFNKRGEKITFYRVLVSR